MIPESKGGGRPHKVNLREVINAILYLNRTGCLEDMLPHDLLPKSTVYEYFAQWREDGTWAKFVDALRVEVRTEASRESIPRGTGKRKGRQQIGITQTTAIPLDPYPFFLPFCLPAPLFS